jgi:WD40 repeat protein
MRFEEGSIMTLWPNRRSWLSRATFWVATLTCLTIAAVEVRGRLAYTATLSRLQEAINTQGNGRPLQRKDAQSLFSSAPAQRQIEVQQNSVQVLSWYSFVRDYTIRLSWTTSGDFVALETGRIAAQSPPNTAPWDANDEPPAPVPDESDPQQLARERVATMLARSRENSEAERAFADVVLPDSHAFDVQTTKAVQEMFDANPRLPLPAQPAGPPVAGSSEAEKEWYRKLYVVSYEKFGSHNPKWDRGAAAFLSEAAQVLAEDSADSAVAAKVVEPGAALVQSGCDDPLVQMACAALFGRVSPEKRNTFREEAFDRFRDSRYPLERVLRITLPLAGRLHWTRLIHAYRKRSADLDQDGILGSDPDPAVRRYLLRACHRGVYWSNYLEMREFLEAVYSVPQFDPWLKAMLSARYFSELASGRVDFNSDAVRGKGRDARHWIMPMDQYAVRYRHSLSAQAFFLDAWRLDPRFPEPAYGVLQESSLRRTISRDYSLRAENELPIAATDGPETGLSGTSVAETMRFWFDQVVRAQFDLMPAYQQMLLALQEETTPSEQVDGMLAFGRECLATERFDTPVPNVLLTVVNSLRPLAKDDGILQLPGVYEDCRKVVAGYLAAARSDRDRNALKSQAACLAVRSRRFDDARRQLAELGDLADVAVFNAQGVDLAEVRRSLNEKHVNHLIFPELDHGVAGLAFGGDEDTLLTADGDARRVTQWSLKDQTSTGVFLQEDDVATAVAASPDGKIIATAGVNGTVILWDAETRAVKRALAHEATVRVLQFSRRGDFLATSTGAGEGNGGTVRVWNTATGEERARRTAADARFHSIAFVGDETVLALAGGSILGQFKGAPGEISLWDFEGDRIVKTFQLFASLTLSVAASRDGRFLAATGLGYQLFGAQEYFPTEIRLVDLKQEGEVVRTLTLPTGGIAALSFVGNGEILATAGPDNVIRLWSVPAGRMLAEFSGHQFTVSGLAISPTATRLASVDTSGTLRIWKLAGPETASQAAGKLLEFPFHQVVRIAVTDGGQFVATGDRDAGVIFWDRASGWHPSEVFAVHDRLCLRDFDISPDGTSLVLVGETMHTDRFLPDEKKGGVIQLWDISRRTIIKQLDGHKQMVLCARFSPDGKILATGGLDGKVILWNVGTGRSFDWGELTEHVGMVASLGFSPDGKTLATGDRQSAGNAPQAYGTVKLWELPGDPYAAGIRLTSRQTLKPFEPFGVVAVSFSPTGKSLLVFDMQHGFIYDVASGKRILEAHDRKGAYSLDGDRLITVSGDQVRIWNPSANQLPQEYRVPAAGTWTAITPTPDGRHFLAAAQVKGRIVVWDATTGTVLERLSEALGEAGDK